MTAGEWIIFLIFTISINVLFQVIAWKLARIIVQKEQKLRQNEIKRDINKV